MNKLTEKDVQVLQEDGHRVYYVASHNSDRSYSIDARAVGSIEDMINVMHSLGWRKDSEGVVYSPEDILELNNAKHFTESYLVDRPVSEAELLGQIDPYGIDEDFLFI